MGISKRIGQYGIVHAHLTIVATPLLGMRKGQQWPFRTLESVDVTLSLKYASVGGTQITPVAIALAGSEPKWSGECSFGEVREIRRWLGKGWAAMPMNLTLTWQVPGRPAFTDKIFGAYLGDEGMSSKKDGIVMSKVGSNIVALWPDGIDPFGDITTGE